MISRLYMAIACLYSSLAQTRPCRTELFKPPVKATHRLPDKLRMDSNLRQETDGLIYYCFSRFGRRFVLLRVFCVLMRPCVTIIMWPICFRGFKIKSPEIIKQNDGRRSPAGDVMDFLMCIRILYKYPCCVSATFTVYARSRAYHTVSSQLLHQP